MNDQTLNIRRKSISLTQDYARVIAKFYRPDGRRTNHIIKRILKLTEEEVEEKLNNVFDDFSDRHKDLDTIFKKHSDFVKKYIPRKAQISENRKCLIGAYFTHEYSIEAAAFFNPSIVMHPDQSGVKENESRIILSFRATGEGHISSIEFRSGVLDEKSNITFDPISRYVEQPKVISNPKYDKHTFQLKLEDLESWNEISDNILYNLENQFTLFKLQNAVQSQLLEKTIAPAMVDETITNILWLAKSNYEVKFDKNHRISERVIFPVSENERNGIEDARFVRFINEKGEVTYYATYTAFNGFKILPQLIETKDFLHFKIITLNGKAAQNKGMALFPRKVNGKYMMVSRQDGENMYIMSSDNIHFWHKNSILRTPRTPWEFYQIGNCGSPIETKHGWLLLTHGVGAMREYSIGVDLLDLKDPSKIIGSLKEPLLSPNAMEREGYVPNVVYSCGSMIHNDELIIPYAMSDTKSGIAVVSLDELFNTLLD